MSVTILNYLNQLNEFFNQKKDINVDDSRITEFSNAIKKGMELFHFSILTGEYYDLVYNKDIIIEDIKNNLAVISDKFQNLLKTSNKKDEVQIIIDNLIILNSCAVNYQYFIEFLSDSLNEHKTNYLYTKLDHLLLQNNSKDNFLSIFKEIKKEDKPQFEPIEKNSLKFEEFIFVISLQISLLDEGYTCDNSTLKLLINIDRKLKLIKTLAKPVIDIISDKIEWLIYKLLYRLDKTEFITEYKIYDEVTEKNIAYDIQHTDIVNNSIYMRFNEKLEKGYPNKRSKVNDDEFIDSFLKSDKLPEVNELHYLSKILKADYLIKNNFSESQFEILKDKLVDAKNEYSRKYNYSKRNFDGYAFQSAIGLIINALFKLYYDKLIILVIKNDQLDVLNERILLLITRIKNESLSESDMDNDKIQSLFQLIRICSKSTIKLIEVLKDKFDNEEYIEKNKKYFIVLIENIRKLIAVIITHIVTLKAHISPAKQGRWMPIYLTKEECTLKFNNENKEQDYPTHLTIDSSYILPSNYDILEKALIDDISNLSINDFSFRGKVSVKILDTYDSRLKEEVNKVLELKNDTEKSVKEILKDVLKENNNEFNSKVKDSQMNAIQYLGLYAGIITFVLSSVSIVPKFDYSYTNILLFMFTFACCLCLFVFLLRFLFVESSRTFPWFFWMKNVSVRNVMAFSLFSFLLLISSIWIKYNRNTVDTKFNNTISTKIFQKDTSNNVCNDTIINIIETKGNYFPKLEETKK